MFASYHTGSLVLIVALFMCYPGNVYAQAEESVTIQLTVQVCTKGEKNTFKHEIAKKAKVFARNEALVKSGPNGDAWETDNDGKVTLKIPRGTDHPITIYIIFDGSIIPEIAHLSANAKSHELVVAVKSIALYESFYAKNQLAVPAHIVAKKTQKDLKDVKDSKNDADQAAIKDVETVVKNTTPRSMTHSELKAQPKQTPLNKNEEQAIKQCLSLLRQCAVTKKQSDKYFGSFRTASPPNNQGWLNPEFGSAACLALLAGVEAQVDKPNMKADMKMALDWLEYYSNFTNADGIVPTFDGFFNQELKEVPIAYGHDLCAARFLTCLGKYHRLAPKEQFSRNILQAAITSLDALQSLHIDDEAVTIAKEDYTFRIFTSNVEVYTAYVLGGHFCINMANQIDAKNNELGYLKPMLEYCGLMALIQADSTAVALRKYIKPEAIAWAKGEGEQYADGELALMALANLYGLAYLGEALNVEARQAIWKTTEAVKPDAENVQIAIIPQGRWLPALKLLPATEKIAGKSYSEWRAETVKEALKFSRNSYVVRPAYAVLGLLDGPGRFLTVEYPKAAE